MSQKANPTQIGVFIIVGAVLGVAGILAFSSGRLFRDQYPFILYFDGSLKGLSPGAPVRLRGVTIGSVKEVLINHNQATNDYTKPVIVEIDPALVSRKSDRHFEMGNPDFVADLIRRGFRGKLDAESLVTGVLYVDVEMMPEAPPPVFHQLTPEYIEIPTVKTDIDELLSNLAHFDVRGISDKLNAVLTRLDTTFAELNVKELSSRTTNLLASVERVASSPDLAQSLVGLRQVLTDARNLVQKLDQRVDPVADGLTRTLAQAQSTLAEMRRAMEGLAGMVEPDAPLRTEISGTLDQLGQAARSVADLAEFLERNPNALITGRKPPRTHP